MLERYLATVVLGSKLDALADSERAGFVTEVRLAMDEPVVDYVRLEIDARRGSLRLSDDAARPDLVAHRVETVDLRAKAT